MTIERTLATLLGIQDLNEIPKQVVDETGYGDRALVVGVEGRWKLLGYVGEIKVHQDYDVIETTSAFGQAYLHRGNASREMEVSLDMPALDIIRGIFETRKHSDLRLLFQGNFFRMSGFLREIGDIEISGPRISVNLEFSITSKVEVSSEIIKTLEQRALDFANRAHSGQVRRYDGRPYVYHPIAVAQIVRSFPHTEAMIAACLLHDVVEETSVTIEDIRQEFGDEVAELVGWLTNAARPSDGNRQRRKEIDRDHIAKAPPEAKTIKLADIIDNCGTIARHDHEFWKVYREEKRLQLEVLKEGNPTLWQMAKDKVELE